MADWSSPQLSSTYTVFRQALNDRLVDAALMFDSASTSAINIPTGAKGWNSSASRFEEYDGTNWNNLSELYAINISGNAATATTATTANSLASGVALANLADKSISYAKIQDISAQYRVLGRNSSGVGPTQEVTVSQLLDWISSTRGSVLNRGASGWGAISPGTMGQVYTCGGAGADPSWTTIQTTRPCSIKSSGYTVLVGDISKVFLCSATLTLTLPAAATAGNGFFFGVKNTGTGVVTIDPNGSETVEGEATISLYPGQSAEFDSTASDWRVLSRGGGAAVTPAIAASGSTEVSFTGIPSTAKKVSLMFTGLSSNGTSKFIVQGGGASYETTGYAGKAYSENGSTSTAFTTGVNVNYVTTATAAFSSIVTLTKLGGYTWVVSGSTYSTALENSNFIGHVTFIGNLARLRITTEGGVDTFDGGSVAVSWE